MNHKKPIRYIILILFISLSSLNRIASQEKYEDGYIITNNNDTIMGKIKTINFGEDTKCVFRKNGDSEDVTYTPSNIQAYRYLSSGKYFISKLTPINGDTKQIFLEYIVKGKISFYYLKDSENHYFVEKEKNVLFELSEPETILKDEESHFYKKAPQYVGKLKYLMSDCPDVYSEIDKIELTPEKLASLAKNYHNHICFDSVCIVYEKPKDKIKFSWGITAGISSNDFKIGDTYYSDMKSSYYVGGIIEINNLFFLGNFVSLNSGLIFQKYPSYTFHKMYNVDYYGTLWKDSVLMMNVNALYTRIPIIFNVYFLYGKLRPYLSAGVTNSFILKQEYEDLLPKYLAGIHLGAGIKYGFKTKGALLLEINWVGSRNYTSQENAKTVIKQFSLQCKYLF